MLHVCSTGHEQIVWDDYCDHRCPVCNLNDQLEELKDETANIDGLRERIVQLIERIGELMDDVKFLKKENGELRDQISNLEGPDE